MPDSTTRKDTVFPDFLDGAKVILFSEKGQYGSVTDYDSLGKATERGVCYLAICRYDADPWYYLFGCDARFEVISDLLCESIARCKGCSPASLWNEKPRAAL